LCKGWLPPGVKIPGCGRWPDSWTRGTQARLNVQAETSQARNSWVDQSHCGISVTLIFEYAFGWCWFWLSGLIV
jgi:hypothetical protein